ncbi:MAG TPA: thiolase family protein [Pseudonocardia sp.]
MSTPGATAIAGLGLTDVGKVYDRTAGQFAAEAVRLAVADAGLAMADVDGLLVMSGLAKGVDLGLADTLGLSDLGLLAQINAYGATAGAMVEYASMAVANGSVSAVACVFADAPLRTGTSAGGAWTNYTTRGAATGLASLRAASGFSSAAAQYALAARRHMLRYGTTSAQLGAIAVAQRQWAQHNPHAQFRAPITLADHQNSRMISDPLHLLDCCLVSNGGAAVIVTSAERARDLRQPPAYVWGWGQGHPGYSGHRGSEFGLVTGAVQAGRTAMKMAGITPAEVTIREIYDCYTYTTLVTLEDYGFCTKGEGGPLAESGALGPGGSLPTNTGGGQLSSYYLVGMTPLLEAVTQARGHGGARQVENNNVILVSGNGGILAHHATLVLSPQPR